MAAREIADSTDFRSVSIALIAMNLFGIGLGYVTTILIARNLDHNGFELYITAVSTLGILSVLGEAGFGKYALRIVPALMAEDQPAKLRSYLVFSVVGAVLVSTALAMAVFLLESYLWKGASGRVIQSALMLLPLIATAAVVVDLWLSLGYAITGTLISRIVIPATTLLLLAVAANETGLTLRNTIVFYGAGSLAALVVSLTTYVLVVRPRAERWLSKRIHFGATELHSWRSWIGPSVSYMVFNFMIAWLSRSTLFLAGHLPHWPHELAILTPAFETGCLVLVLSKATDKFYQPKMSGYLETEQYRTMKHMHRIRTRIVGIGVIAFMVSIVLLGKSILSLYGARFTAGYPALCLITLGSGLWTLYSLTPSFLLYSGGEKLLSVLLAVHCVISLVLMTILFPRMGALGAAIAYAATVSSFGISNMYFARRRLQQLSRPSPSHRGNNH